MKFKSALITSASGSIGGMTLAHNSGGLYARARTIPVDPSSAKQLAVRNAMASLAAEWKDPANASARTNWAWYAQETPLPDSFGDERPIPPLAMFCRCNVPRLQASLARVLTGPVDTGVATATLPVPTGTVASQLISVAFTNTDAWAGEAGGAMLVYASEAQSAAIEFFKGPYRYAGKVVGATSPHPTSPQTFAAPFVLRASMTTFVQIRVTRADGRLSAAYRFRFTPS